jgi:hypothetical protein
MSQTPHRPRRSATLLNDEFSQSLNETPYYEDVRRRAIDADPNQGKICLISNSEGLAIHLCHVVDRATPTNIVSVFQDSEQVTKLITLSRSKV